MMVAGRRKLVENSGGRHSCLGGFWLFPEFLALVFGVFWRRTSDSLSENARYEGCYTHLEPKVSGRKFAVSGMESAVSGNCHVYKNEKLAKNRRFRWIFGENWPHDSVLESILSSNLKTSESTIRRMLKTCSKLFLEEGETKMGVRHIHSAKNAKNDEFYTRFEDAENELRHYADLLAGKRVWCPCDSEESAFWKFLSENFGEFRLASLTATSRDQSGGALLVALESGDCERMRITSGDMFSDECQQFLRDSDVVITNPPFSEFRRIIRMCQDAGKDFILVAPVYALTYDIVFKGLKSGAFRIGFTRIKTLLFDTPSGDAKKIPSFFLTSLPIAPDVKPLPPRCETMHDYEHLTQFDALNVSCVKDIPRDVQSAIALPVTSMRSFDPETLLMNSEDGAQFRVLAKLNSPRVKESSRILFQRVIVKEI